LRIIIYSNQLRYKAKSGILNKVISQRAGHANESNTLKIYTHFSKKDDDRKASDKFTEFLKV